MLVVYDFHMLVQSGFLANSSDIAPRHAGKVYGLANMCGSFAGLVGTWIVGIIVDKTGSFSSVFRITAGLYVLGLVHFNLYCTGEKVFD